MAPALGQGLLNIWGLAIQGLHEPHVLVQKSKDAQTSCSVKLWWNRVRITEAQVLPVEAKPQSKLRHCWLLCTACSSFLLSAHHPPHSLRPAQMENHSVLCLLTGLSALSHMSDRCQQVSTCRLSKLKPQAKLLFLFILKISIVTPCWHQGTLAVFNKICVWPSYSSLLCFKEE